MEKDIQNLLSENELLKQRLHSQSLVDQSLSSSEKGKEQSNLKGDIDGNRKLFVEGLADWMFKFNHVGVTDINNSIIQFTGFLFKYSDLLSSLDLKDTSQWVLIFYSKMVEMTSFNIERKFSESANSEWTAYFA